MSNSTELGNGTTCLNKINGNSLIKTNWNTTVARIY